MSDQQRREFHELLLHADLEDLPSTWQAEILAEQAPPKLRVVGGD
jgi:hypothetical protein